MTTVFRDSMIAFTETPLKTTPPQKKAAPVWRGNKLGNWA